MPGMAHLKNSQCDSSVVICYRRAFKRLATGPSACKIQVDCLRVCSPGAKLVLLPMIKVFLTRKYLTFM